MSKLPNIVKQGLQAFNQAEFYKAHEYFEDAWRDTLDESREFYRALLHLSGGYFRLTQNRPKAAKKFFSRAQHWLENFPSPHFDLDIDSIRTQLGRLIMQIDAGKPAKTLLEENTIQIQWNNQENGT